MAESSGISDLLQTGLAHHRRGAIDDARAIYRQVLASDPANPDALLYLAMISCQRGHFDDGVELACKSLSINPRNARAQILLGRALNALGRYEESLSSLERAIDLDPELAEAHGNRGDVLGKLERNDEAVESYDRALALAPQSTKDWFNRGVSLAALGRSDEALASFSRIARSEPEFAQAKLWQAKLLTQLTRYEEALAFAVNAIESSPDLAEARLCQANILNDLKRYQEASAAYDKALSIAPNSAEAWLGLGNLRRDLDRYDESLEAYDKALAINPGLAAAWNGRGNVLRDLERYDEALISYDKALELRPDFAAAALGRGNTSHDKKRFDDALVAYDNAVALDPRLAQAWIGRGNVFRDVNRLDDALAAYDKACALNSNLAEAWSARGVLLYGKARFDEALVSCDRALAIKPRYPEAWVGRGNALFETGHLTEALAAFEQALAIKPDYGQAISNRIFALDFFADVSLEQQQRARGEWWRRVGSVIANKAPHVHSNARDPGKRIRLGYVSADFRVHSAALALRPVLTSHDRSNFEVNLYSCSPIEDDFTRQFRAVAHNWRDAWRMSDDELAARIRQDQIDILVDLSGHSAGGRLGVFARKPAPVQVTAWGHATGTGLPTIDYLFSDPVVCPAEVRHLFAEKIFDLPCLITIDPLPGGVSPTPPPVQSKGHTTFGVFNRASKTSGETVAVWACILQSVKNSKILLKHSGYEDAFVRSRVLDLFRQHGVSEDRVQFAGSTPHLEHLARFGEVDISLDPFPQNGGISTWESLQIGVPVVAKLGSSMAGRLAGSIISAVGQSEWVANSDDEYVAIATKFAAMPEHLAKLRRELPLRVAQSEAGDRMKYTRAVEAAYRKMWKDYCQEQQA